ncbi:MAG: Obg family GTPase CgtA [Candidatus Saccharibacteria bacterium]
MPDSAESYKVTKEEGGGYRLTGERLERFAGRTDFSNEEALDRFRDILRRMGVIHELTRRGLRPGDLIYIGKNDIASFNF